MRSDRSPALLVARWCARRVLQGKWWRLKVVLFCTLLVAVLAPPNATTLFNYFSTTRPDIYEPVVNAGLDRFDAIRIKLQDPFAEMARYYPHERQEAKRTYRFTIPLIAGTLGFNLTGALLLGMAAGPVIFWSLSVLASRISRGRLFNLAVCCFASALYLGQSFLLDLSGCFDAWGYAFILLGMVARSPWQAGLMVLLAAFTDERAAVASPAILLYHLALNSSRKPPSLSMLWSGMSVALALAGLAYAGIRILLVRTRGLETFNMAEATHLFSDHGLSLGAFSLFCAWKAGVVLTPFALWSLMRKPGWLGWSILWMVGVAASLHVAYMALDHTRGLTNTTAYLVVLLAWLRHSGTSPSTLLHHLWPACLVSLLSPNVGVHGHIKMVRPLPVEILALLRRLLAW